MRRKKQSGLRNKKVRVSRSCIALERGGGRTNQPTLPFPGGKSRGGDNRTKQRTGHSLTRGGSVFPNFCQREGNPSPWVSNRGREGSQKRGGRKISQGGKKGETHSSKKLNEKGVSNRGASPARVVAKGKKERLRLLTGEVFAQRGNGPSTMMGGQKKQRLTYRRGKKKGGRPRCPNPTRGGKRLP